MLLQGKSDLEALYGSSADFDELEGMLAAVSEAYTELWQAPCCSPATRAAPLESTDAADRFEAWARKVVDGAVNIAQPVSKALGALETGDGDGHDKNDVDGMEEEGNKTGHGDEVWDGDYEREGHGTQRQFQPAYYCDYDECDYSGEHYDYDDFREDGEADVTDDIVQVLSPVEWKGREQTEAPVPTRFRH